MVFATFAPLYKLMLQLAGWSILISILHGLFPNHWMPSIAIGKTNNWSNAKSLKITTYLALIHIFSTLLFGVVIYWVGRNLLEDEHFFELITSWGFIVFGVFYFVSSKWLGGFDKHGSKKYTIAYLSLLMLLSPCIEIFPFFFNASAYGLYAFLIIGVIYTFFSLFGVLLMAYFGLKTMERFEHNFLLQNERYIISLIFILVGVFNFIFE